jgi:hypothetical protein
MHDQQLYEPASFAIDCMRTLRGRFGSICELEAPRELASYKKARAAHLRSLPDGEPPYAVNGKTHPFHTMDESVFAAVGAAYEAGLAAGARWEGLRRELVPDVAPCPVCHGIGSRSTGIGSMAGSDDPCPECSGSGLTGAMEDDDA